MKVQILGLLGLVALTGAALADPTPEPRSLRAVGEWSKPVNGLSARLVLILEELKHEGSASTHRYVAIVELKNVGVDVVAVSSHPSFAGITVNGADGKPVAECGYIQDGTIPSPQWAHIPGYDAYLGVRVDMRTVLPLTRLRGDSALLAIDDNVYSLGPGRYSLCGTLVAKKDKDGPDDQWHGEIKLEEVGFSFKTPEH